MPQLGVEPIDGRGARLRRTTRLAWIVGGGGLVVAAFTAMSGEARIFGSIAIASCFVAGLLFSVGRDGWGGAIQVLVFPLTVAAMSVMAIVGEASGGADDGLQVFALGAIPIVAFIALCTEAGYAAGCLVARGYRARHAYARWSALKSGMTAAGTPAASTSISVP